MEWQGRTDGNRWMQQQLINCFRFLSLHIYYMGVAVVVPFYMLFGKGFKASYGFYRKRFGWSALKSFWWSYKNHYRFGQVMIDRFARYAGKTFTLTTENLELYNELEQGDDAFVMLSAHVGNYEMGGFMLQRVVLPRQTREVMGRRGTSRQVLQDLRDALVALTPTADAEPARLNRFSTRTVLMAVVALVAVWTLLAQLDFQQVSAAVSQANVWWMLAALAFSVATYVGAGLTLVAFSPKRLSFRIIETMRHKQIQGQLF